MTLRPCILATVCVAAALAWQSPREFEAATIKPDDPARSYGGGAHIVNSPPGRYEAINLSLKVLLMTGWHLNENQVIGANGWIDTTGWDVSAKYPAGATNAQLPEMMQSLLTTRFGLIVHRETRQLPIYSLTVTKGGLKLKKSIADGGMSAGPRMISYRKATVAELARQLTSLFGRTVLDKTNIAGEYEISLKFAALNSTPTDADASLPSIFTALEEQAGLKLESGKGPVEVIVIDKADKPTPN